MNAEQKPKEKKLSMRIVNPNAAGIDVGSRSHWVAIDQVVEHVREFGIYTKDHEDMIVHLKEHKITTVAMESTGSYWQTLFSALQRAGFEVILVNGSHTKNVKGKKTDVLDCMWIQKLHTIGLLSGSFLLTDYLQSLRTYYDHRQHLIEQTSKYINKMQKALRLMNVRLDVALRDIMGLSGRTIIEAILSGQRDPEHLASLAHSNVKKSKEEIAASLQGQWREELLYELKSCLFFHDMYQKAITECDKKMEALLLLNIPLTKEILSDQPLRKVSKSTHKHAPVFNVRHIAFAYFKTDLFEIPGISHTTVLCLLSNMGNDIKRFKTAKQFASWMRLTPNNKVSGGKIISSRTPKGRNKIALALRQAANSIGNVKNHLLTPFFRRIAYRKGRNAAITATARKLAIIIWNMITKTEPFRQFDYSLVNENKKAVQLRALKRKILRLNLDDSELRDLLPII